MELEGHTCCFMKFLFQEDLLVSPYCRKYERNYRLLLCISCHPEHRRLGNWCNHGFAKTKLHRSQQSCIHSRSSLNICGQWYSSMFVWKAQENKIKKIQLNMFVSIHFNSLTYAFSSPNQNLERCLGWEKEVRIMKMLFVFSGRISWVVYISLYTLFITG